MRTGTCPNCGENKEITDAGVMNGMCDDCYKKKYTCVVCGKMITDAWTLWFERSKGNGHKECFRPQAIKSAE